MSQSWEKSCKSGGDTHQTECEDIKLSTKNQVKATTLEKPFFQTPIPPWILPLLLDHAPQ
ncbi:MAG: hypothetical protein COB67_12740 [SAR324 cluster bacterium]|uniref:Uncharacterized protein n=1 Tax=SAR324 cluster bacterium TaxID=2024889 RepID=A0A2A4SQH6_9DELT|nr:MAG: hypothetical protein COB67_12740 [SAR324 cluster bacterium]